VQPTHLEALAMRHAGRTQWLRRRMGELVLLALAAVSSPLWVSAQTAKSKLPPHYYPDANWQRKPPVEFGIDPRLLKEAREMDRVGPHAHPGAARVRIHELV
jgi:hypothetical protein